MNAQTHCPECGDVWTDGQTCLDHFHVMLAWELEHQLYDVHHLLVLSYYLQHPSLYSPEALRDAMGLLREFVEQNVSPQEMRQRIRGLVDSGVRDQKIAGTPDRHGEYKRPISWEMHAADAARAGIEHYYASVRRWAESVLSALREAGELPASTDSARD